MSMVLLKRLSVEGFLLADHAPRFAEARARIAGLLADGAIRPVETIHRGLARAPAAFAALFGADTPPGKQIVELVEEDWR
jgi:NADPH-dependent curcumin reductase CurA